MMTNHSRHSEGRRSSLPVLLGLVLAALVLGGGLLIRARQGEPAAELADRELPARSAPAGTAAPPQPPAGESHAAPPPRFARAPSEPKLREPELSKDTPFDPQELRPPARYRRDAKKVRDNRLNELITKANLDPVQTQKLLTLMESTNAQLDQAYTQIVVPHIPSTDPAQREKARLEFMKALVQLTHGFERTLAELGPQTQKVASEMNLDMTNLLTPEQSYQLRSFLKRFGRKLPMDSEPAAPPAPPPPPEPSM